MLSSRRKSLWWLKCGYKMSLQIKWGLLFPFSFLPSALFHFMAPGKTTLGQQVEVPFEHFDHHHENKLLLALSRRNVWGLLYSVPAHGSWSSTVLLQAPQWHSQFTVRHEHEVPWSIFKMWDHIKQLLLIKAHKLTIVECFLNRIRNESVTWWPLGGNTIYKLAQTFCLSVGHFRWIYV